MLPHIQHPLVTKLPSRKQIHSISPRIYGNSILKDYIKYQYRDRKYCTTYSEKNSCRCGFICKPCRETLYTRKCFACDGNHCTTLLCQQCVVERMCSKCINAYCVDCEYGNISTCMSCGEKNVMTVWRKFQMQYV